MEMWLISNSVPGAYRLRDCSLVRCERISGPGSPGKVTMPCLTGWLRSTMRRAARASPAWSGPAWSGPAWSGALVRHRLAVARPAAGALVRLGEHAEVGEL